MASVMRSFLHRITNRSHDRADSLVGSEDGSRSLSRHSSIHGPYREGMQDTSFPLYRIIEIPLRIGEIYARSLFSLGHGVGLQDIIGDLGRPKEQFNNGALVGDVGSIDDTGSFSFCFNIFFPPNHPVNPNELPQGYTPFEPSLPIDNPIMTSEIFKPGTVLASEGITISRIPDSKSKIEFTTSAREGAVLVLPTGASREELVDPSILYPYIKEHAASWYQFHNGTSDNVTSGKPASNGTLWVVTGVDRVKSWCSATFPIGKTDVGKRRQFILDGDTPRSPWTNKEGSYEPCFEATYLTDGTQEWSRNVAYIPPESVECYSSLPVPVVGRRARVHYSTPRISRLSRHASVPIPEVIFHPSIPLLHILILTDPTAQVAVVPDSVWISQLNIKRHLTHPEIVQLIRRVINNFDIVNTDGIITFMPKAKVEEHQNIPNPQKVQQIWFFHQIHSWLKKSEDTTPRGRALRYISKVLPPS